jgi:hypothetical protein
MRRMSAAEMPAVLAASAGPAGRGKLARNCRFFEEIVLLRFAPQEWNGGCRHQTGAGCRSMQHNETGV